MRRLKMLIATLGAAIPFVFAQSASADDAGWRVLVDSSGNVGVSYYAHSGDGYGRASYGAYGSRYDYGRYGRGYRDQRRGYAPRHRTGRPYARGYDRGYDRGYRRGYRSGHDDRGYSGHGRRGGYSSQYDRGRGHGYQSRGHRCEQVYKHGRWHGRPAKIGGTRCFDRYGNAYIVQGSRYLIDYY